LNQKDLDCLRERNEALASLDRWRIDAWFAKYKPDKAPPKDNRLYWGFIHTARLRIGAPTFNRNDLRLSAQWLRKNGFPAWRSMLRRGRPRTDEG
jgi:hypothetical protein